MNGLVHIYCGDGKGKTTAALGLALRACGGGYQVVLAQFMKAWDTAELKILRELQNITVLRGDFPAKFSKDYTKEEREAVIRENNRLFQEAVSGIAAGVKTLLILDEMIGTMDIQLIDRDMVYHFLENRTCDTEVVLTGRNPSERLIGLADYVSEIRKIRHPYEKGIAARKGIEF